MDFGHKILNEWYLDESVVFLNNGSFGATPKVVLEAQFEIIRKLEREPLTFFLDDYNELLNIASVRLAGFVGSEVENIVFVENATTGVNTVLRSLINEINPGDELLTTNHVYPGVKNAMQYVADKTGAKYVEADIPFHIDGSAQIAEIIKKSLNEKTKIAVFDHITSPTAIIFPVKELIEICHAYNTIVVIDGAHTPGMLELNIEELKPDFYTGNCHKWMFTPKGCAFLWVNKNYHDEINPLCISLDYNKGFRQEFAWTGTKNPSSWLVVPESINFYEKFGKNEIMSYNHKLAIEARNEILNTLHLDKPCSDDMIGSMASFEMPGNLEINPHSQFELRKHFLKEYRIELPFIVFDNKLLFRVSAQIFNEIEDIYKLIDAIEDFNKTR